MTTLTTSSMARRRLRRAPPLTLSSLARTSLTLPTLPPMTGTPLNAQVDRGLSGHLGAGVPLQVAEVTRTFSNLKKKDSALYTSLYYLLLQLSLKSLHSSSISDIILGEEHQAAVQGQKEEPEGG